jgi:hypothetical protein
MMLEVEIVMALQALRAWLDKQGWRKLTAPEHFLFERVIIYFQNKAMEGSDSYNQTEDRIKSLEAEVKAKEISIDDLRSSLRTFVSYDYVVDAFRDYYKSETGKNLTSASNLSIAAALRDTVNGEGFAAARRLSEAIFLDEEKVLLTKYAIILRNFIRRDN